MECPAHPRKCRREADGTAAANRLLLAAEEQYSVYSPIAGDVYPMGIYHRQPLLPLTQQLLTFVQPSPRLFGLHALLCPLGRPQPLPNPLVDVMLVLIGHLPPFPAATTGMMTAGNSWYFRFLSLLPTPLFWRLRWGRQRWRRRRRRRRHPTALPPYRARPPCPRPSWSLLFSLEPDLRQPQFSATS